MAKEIAVTLVTKETEQKQKHTCTPPDTEDRLLELRGEVTEGLNNPCRVPLIVMDRKRLGEVGRRPKKALPEDAILR